MPGLAVHEKLIVVVFATVLTTLVGGNVGVVVDTDEELPLAPAAVLAVTT